MNIEIANRLQKLRKEKGYSQEQLADMLGISRQAVSKWERAEASPDTDNLICLARLYGISLDELLFTNEKTEDIISEKSSEKQLDDIGISFNGINVKNTDGSSRHIGWDGVKVYESGTGKRISVSAMGCHYEEDDSCSRKKQMVREALNGSTILIICIIYFILGAFNNLWHPGWIIFFFFPIISSLIDCFIKKRISCFCYPIAVLVVYLVLGFVYNLWHPYWFIFITIPLFYIFANLIDNLLEKKENPNDIDDDNGEYDD